MATCRRAGTNEQIATYGTGKTYTEGNLTTWEQATDTDHVTDTETDVLEVYKEGVAGGLWDDVNTLDGSTNDADYFRIIRAASGEGHSGIPKDDGSIAGFRTTSDLNTLRINETYSQCQDLVFKCNPDSVNSRSCVNLSTDETKAIGCLAYDSSNAGTGNGRGFNVTAGVGNVAYVIDCLAHNCESDGFVNSNGTGYYYNCTAQGNGDDGFDQSGGTATCKNCLSDGNTGSDYEDVVSDNTNMSSDATSPTVALRNQTNVFVNAAGDDFHLAVSDDAIDEGTDLSADGTFAFDDDINDGVMGAGKAGETRSGTWDIGFDEYITALITLTMKPSYANQIAAMLILSVAGNITLALKYAIQRYISTKSILSIVGSIALALKNAIHRIISQKPILSVAGAITLALKNAIQSQIVQKIILSVAGTITLAMKHPLYRQIAEKLTLVVTGPAYIILTIKHAIQRHISTKPIPSVAGSIVLALKNAIQKYVAAKTILSVAGTISLAMKNAIQLQITKKITLTVTTIVRVTLSLMNAIQYQIAQKINMKVKIRLVIRNTIQSIKSLIGSLIIKMKAAVGIKQFRTKAIIYNFPANAQTYSFRAQSHVYNIISKAV